MMPSTIPRISSRRPVMICSAIFSGSSCWKNSLGVPSLAMPLSTARLPIFAARDGMMPCQPIPPTMIPGIWRSL